MVLLLHRKTGGLYLESCRGVVLLSEVRVLFMLDVFSRAPSLSLLFDILRRHSRT